jgi:hypothetical protein
LQETAASAVVARAAAAAVARNIALFMLRPTLLRAFEELAALFAEDASEDHLYQGRPDP